MFKYILFILIFFALFLPFQADAQDRGFLRGPLVQCSTDPCGLCDIFVVARNVIGFIFELTLVIAPIFIVIGGIIMLTSAGSPDRVAFGKKVITYVIIGLIIAFASWTVLNMLFNTLIGSEGFPWPWHTPACRT